jgi:hypothetical protein
MANDPAQKRTMRRYLLGQMSEEERARFEEQYTANKDMFEELVAAENELIGEYLSWNCSELERKQIALHVLHNPEWRDSIAFAKSHIHLVSEETPGQRPGEDELPIKQNASGDLPQVTESRCFDGRLKRYAAPALWLALVAASCLVVLSNLQLRHKLERQRAEQASLRAEVEGLRHQPADAQSKQVPLQLSAGRPSAGPRFPRGTTITFPLTLELSRQAGSQESLFIPSGIDRVRLQLRLQSDPYVSYAAFLGTPEGVEIWREKGLHTQQLTHGKRAVILDLPHNRLKRGTYVVKLSGVGADGQEQDMPSYAFHVL